MLKEKFDRNEVMAYKNQSGFSELESRLLFENWINKAQLAQHLNVSVSSINKLMAEEGLPFLKVGRAVRFRYLEVLVWFQRKGMKP